MIYECTTVRNRIFIKYFSGVCLCFFYYAKYLADWAAELSWQKVAKRFATSWHTVAAAVTWIVEYGLAHRRVDNVTTLGVDEVAWKTGHNYLTLVYQIDTGMRRLLWIGEKRTQATMKAFFNEFEAHHNGFAEKIKVVCSDMWKPYLKIIQAKCDYLPSFLRIGI